MLILIYEFILRFYNLFQAKRNYNVINNLHKSNHHIFYSYKVLTYQ